MLHRESNMEGDEIELEWKNCEDSSLDKMAVKSVIYSYIFEIFYNFTFNIVLYL